MHVAAYYDSLEAFAYFESLGFDSLGRTAARYLPLHYACAGGALEVCAHILSREPGQAAAVPEVEHHLIFLATTSGDARLLRLLFACGADLSAPRNRCDRPVEQAIRTRAADCLRLLL